MKPSKSYIKKIKEDLTECVNNSNDGSIEESHENADDILCDLLVKIGYSEVIDIYRKVRKWYA